MTILLHHYDASPFSEKIRICLGIKRLAWRAVEQPVIMPKPDLVALTGGYRRIPVMQIGADIYCDSVLIARALERRFPEPSLCPGGAAGLDQAAAQWTDRGFFQAAVTVIFAGLGDTVDPAFLRDREALSGQPFDPVAMRAAAPYMAGQLRAHAALASEQLDDGRAFLGGARPGLVDASVYYNLWFVRSFYPPAAAAFADLPHLADWMERVRAIGHGERSGATAEEAIAHARAAEPEPGEVALADAAFAGKAVTVSATDYGREPVHGRAGRLVAPPRRAAAQGRAGGDGCRPPAADRLRDAASGGMTRCDVAARSARRPQPRSRTPIQSVRGVASSVIPAPLTPASTRSSARFSARASIARPRVIGSAR